MTPCRSFQEPDFDLNATMQPLKSGFEPVLSSSRRVCHHSIVANSGGKLTEDNRTVDFLQNPSQAQTSAERHRASSSCECKRKDGGDDLDDVRIHRALISCAELTSQIRTCEAPVELVTRHARRSSLLIVIWHHYRNSTTRV